MKIVITILALMLILFLADKVGLWLERKSYLYYRRNKSQARALGSVLLELNVLLSPSNRYIVEMKQNEVRFKKSEADSSGKSVGPN